ncbi:MAG: TrmH family RNA methyltransferase, partial [Brevinematales bacterium]
MMRYTFEKLSVSQKIRKIASIARDVIKDPSRIPLFWECVQSIQNDPHPRLQKAFKNIIDRQKKLLTTPSEWYHLYHDLLALNHETIREEEFLAPIFDREEPLNKWPAGALLCDIRSPFNVGSIIRTAEAFGWEEVSLCGITPPVSHPRVAKTSMHTHEWIFIRSFAYPEEGINFYKEKGYTILALEVSPQSHSLWDFIPHAPFVLVVGNEEFGLSEETLALVDITLSIPLYGRKLSL